MKDLASTLKAVSDPLAPENLLKSSGRGIFLIRSFMDEMVLQRAPQGGMEVVMVKRVAATALGLQNAE
jgi:serine/threonine-protein kinase RsbW